MSDQGGALAAEAFYVTPFLDQNLLMIRDGKTYCYSQDGLGSVRTLRDADGGVVNRYDYTAFGEAWAEGTSENVANRYTYTGREVNPVSGTMHYRQRDFAPYLGRYIQRWHDIDKAINGYEYRSNLPTLFTDPYGDPGPAGAVVASGIAAVAVAVELCRTWAAVKKSEVADTKLRNMERGLNLGVYLASPCDSCIGKCSDCDLDTCKKQAKQMGFEYGNLVNSYYHQDSW